MSKATEAQKIYLEKVKEMFYKDFDRYPMNFKIDQINRKEFQDTTPELQIKLLRQIIQELQDRLKIYQDLHELNQQLLDDSQNSVKIKIFDVRDGKVPKEVSSITEQFHNDLETLLYFSEEQCSDINNIISRINSIVPQHKVDFVDRDEFHKSYSRKYSDVLHPMYIIQRELDKYPSRCDPKYECKCSIIVAYYHNQPIGFVYVFYNNSRSMKQIYIQSMTSTIPFILAKKIRSEIKLPFLNEILIHAVNNYAKALGVKYILVTPLTRQSKILTQHYGFKSIKELKDHNKKSLKLCSEEDIGLENMIKVTQDTMFKEVK